MHNYEFSKDTYPGLGLKPQGCLLCPANLWALSRATFLFFCVLPWLFPNLGQPGFFTLISLDYLPGPDVHPIGLSDHFFINIRPGILAPIRRNRSHVSRWSGLGARPRPGAQCLRDRRRLPPAELQDTTSWFPG